MLELYEQTLATHPLIKGHEFSIEKAEAEKDQALSKLLPQVSAVGNLSWNEMTQPQTNTTTRQTSSQTNQYEGTRGIVQAKQALFDLPSFLRWQGAKSVVLQSEQELEAARMSVSADLVVRYLDTLQAEDELRYLQGEKALTEGDMKRIRRMHELKLVQVTDLYEVEAYYQSLLSKELEAAGVREIALEKLHETSGTPVTAIQPLNEALLPPLSGDVNQWVADALSGHPSVLALSHSIEAAQKLIYGAHMEHAPQVALQVSETYADNGGYDNRQLPHYNVGTVGLQLNVPIYSGGAVEAGARNAVANYHQSLEKRTEKLREIERETRTAYVQARTWRARIESSEQEVKAREKARDAQQRSYELGVTTIVDVLESKKNWLKALFEHAKARYEFIRSLVALKLWRGTLDRPDIEEINAWLDRRNVAVSAR
ncbi:TolC family protein [Methylogaea oryzae]|uniref:TolC family protein n=1 Tax=Methylogaea oryzae TaxID=1295382 RepID=UPI001C3F1B92|nr:TolC family protein [Methylogaea oryzae]